MKARNEFRALKSVIEHWAEVPDILRQIQANYSELYITFLESKKKKGYNSDFYFVKPQLVLLKELADAIEVDVKADVKIDLQPQLLQPV